MLEIILLIFLTRRIGNILEAKGRKSGWYKLLTVLLWFGGEIIGAIIGVVIVHLSQLSEGFVYLFALIGAAIGAAVAFIIAKAVPAPVHYSPPPPPTFT